MLHCLEYFFDPWCSSMPPCFALLLFVDVSLLCYIDVYQVFPCTFLCKCASLKIWTFFKNCTLKGFLWILNFFWSFNLWNVIFSFFFITFFFPIFISNVYFHFFQMYYLFKIRDVLGKIYKNLSCHIYFVMSRSRSTFAKTLEHFFLHLLPQQSFNNPIYACNYLNYL